MNKRFTYLTLLTVLLLVSYSCANVLPLTGGEEDMTPPKVKKMSPPNQSVNNQERKIIIDFDEFVLLKDPNKNILISPPGTKYEVVEKGKRIQLTITDTLKSNTTYVINFGSAIVDNNRGNILENLTYSFSTGDAIDSLQTSFIVLDAFTLKPISDVRVMLYESDIDSLPLTRLPYYAGKTESTGKVNIGYMAQGNYKVFALKDENNTYTYDKTNEKIGFQTQLVEAGDSNAVRILLFKELTAVPSVRKTKTLRAGVVLFKFDGKVEKDQFRIISDNYDLDTSRFEFIGTEQDSAVFWYEPITYQDTLVFEFTDNVGNKDTIKSYPRTKKIPTGKRYDLKIMNSIPVEFDYHKKLELTFSSPVDSIGMDSIIFKEEGKEILAELKPLDALGRKLYLDFSFKENKTYTLYFPKSCLKDIYGNYMDSTVATIKTSSSRSHKTLTMQIVNPELSGAGILELIDDQDEIIERKFVQWQDTNTVVYEKLKVGNYRLRLIYDSNNSGDWNTGNYLAGIQPEKAVYFPKNIEVKSIFDLSLFWDIMAPVKDDQQDLKPKE